MTTQAKPHRTRPRVIVGMENPPRRRALVSALRTDGWIVIPAADGYQLIGRLAAAILDDYEPRPDLIVADATMHGCMGTTILRGIRELQWDTPFILITDFARGWEQQVVELQPTAVFEKPIDVDEVRARVCSLLPKPGITTPWGYTRNRTTGRAGRLH